MTSDKQQANNIYVYGLANIGCTFEQINLYQAAQPAKPEETEVEEAEAAEVTAGEAPVQRPPSVQESFADRVKSIIRKAAGKNGQRMQTMAKGHAGAYIYYIDADAFCKAMDEMANSYSDRLAEFLGGSLNTVQVTKVCFFIGHVIRMHLINDASLQMSDLLFAFEDYYQNPATVKAKLGDKQSTCDQDLVMGTFEGLLRKYKTR